MAIPNFRITDEASFREATRQPREVAGLYLYLQLDSLVTCAEAVAADFFRRPHLYTDTGVADALAELHARRGNHERVPSQPQRDAIFLPVFGQTSTSPDNGSGDFPRLRDELVNAASAFAERVFDTGVEMLRERVRTTHRPFRDFLAGLHGDSLVWSKENALGSITGSLAYSILHSPGVCSVFGVSIAPRAAWPFTEDSNADKLIEEISKQLMASTNGHTVITREVISNRQRAALRGAEALATVLAYNEESREDPDGDLDLLITKVYTWGSALASLGARPAAPVPPMQPVLRP